MTTAPAPPLGTGLRRLSRDDVASLSRQGRVWEFIPAALRVLEQRPDDHAMRLLAAAAYARLGLRSAAGEQLDRLPPTLAGDSSVAALRRALESFPQDEIPITERLALCDANLAALEKRGCDLRAARERWLEQHAGERWLRTTDANIVRRRVDAGPDEAWLHFRNDRLEALNFAFPHLAEPDKPAKPCVVEGFFPPWMLQRLWASTPTAPDGYRTRLGVVQEGEDEALDALACADLREILCDERVDLFLGAGAGRRYAETLNARMHTRCAGPAIVMASQRRAAAPSVVDSLQSFARAQRSEHDRLHAQVASLYAQRDAAWWRRRYAGAEGPLRVLLPTCRYSTFVKHSAADLAEAFRTAGWQARTLIEPDDMSHTSSVGYLRAIAEFEPDLVVLINYTRTSVGDFFPANLPFVCWLQDAMPHQFNAKLAAKQGPMDYLAGYLHREMFTEFGFSRERAALFPVGVSARKFHAAPVDEALRQRVGCDIAYVSHQSETPEAMHARLVRETSAREPLVARIFEALRPVVTEIALACSAKDHVIPLRAAALDAARRVLGADPPAGVTTLITRQYCHPIADRIIRHQTLGWAARVAARRGWTLNIHGRGWEKHPTFAPHARGELEHDEMLRASYQCARLHLHASTNWLLHQRVMECALSGGLPLSRLKACDLIQWQQAALHRAALDADAVMSRRRTGRMEHTECGFAVADHPDAMEYTRQLQLLGEPTTWDMWAYESRCAEFRSIGPGCAEPPAGWILGDLSCTTFRSEAELEALAERAIEDSGWREATSHMIAGRVRRRYTTDALAGILHDLVVRGLTRNL